MEFKLTNVTSPQMEFKLTNVTSSKVEFKLTYVTSSQMEFKLTNLAVIDTDCIFRCKSNHHSDTIAATTSPIVTMS